MLPSKHKLQYNTSSVDKDQVFRETFAKIQTLQQKKDQQKDAVLLQTPVKKARMADW